MPTEDDLRVAFRDLESLTPDPAVLLRAVYEQPQRPARPRRRSPHGMRRPVLRAGLAVGAAGAIAAVAVIAAVAHGPVTRATSLTAPVLRTRLLAAIDSASSDILYTHSGQQGGGAWQWPAYPQAGQEVHFRVLGLASDGAVFKDAEYSFTMPAGNPYTSNLDQGGLNLSGTIMDVNHFRHVWGVWHGHFVLGFTPDAAVIRAEIANGQFTVIGRTELHRQQAIELRINVPPSKEAPPHVTEARLWVDAATYLPMQEYLRMSNGQQGITQYTFLPSTPPNLAEARPLVPAGYSHVSGHLLKLFGQKPLTPKK